MNATTAPQRTSGRTRKLSTILAGVVAAFLVVRAGMELIELHYTSPASYHDDWGGPSLAGVLAVHAGPGLMIVARFAYRLHRTRRLDGLKQRDMAR